MNLEQDTSPSFPLAGLLARARWQGTTGIVLLYLLLGALTLSPLLGVTTPGLVDYPNHLARMWILVHGKEIPALASNYVADWRVLPDLAMDLVVPALAQVMSVETAGKLFVAATMILLVGGTAALHRALYGRVGLWPICSLLFVYNLALAWGFLNCLFGIGVCLFAFAGWIASRNWSAIPRIALFAVVASVLFILHLFAFGLYGLAVASYEIGNRIVERRYSWASFLALCAIGTQFIPALAIWWASLAHSGPAVTIYGGLAEKLFAVLAPFSSGPIPVTLDKLLISFALTFWVVGRQSRALTIAAAMRAPLLTLLVAALLIPNTLDGSWAADTRLPIALIFILIASLKIDAARFRALTLFAAIGLAVLGLRVWAVSEAWRDVDAHFAEFRTAARAITPGARLLVVIAPMPEAERAIPGVPSALAERSDVRFVHIPALAVIDRSVFMPYLFSGWTSISPTARNAGLYYSSSAPPSPEELALSARMDQPNSPYYKPNSRGELPYWRDWQQHFDYLLWLDYGADLPLPRDATLEPVALGSFFKIFRIAKP